MSYYEDKMNKHREYGSKIVELGGEVSIVNDKFIYIGGDDPIAFKSYYTLDEKDVLEFAEICRAIGKHIEYKDMMDQMGLIEIGW